ncbi:hypothetical protein LBMAG42_36310 [Deltaproteobacteria bacterium]|nr:hypothetical protein LBMAG42_36310 [Deltaproteobacteria bacterium]
MLFSTMLVLLPAANAAPIKVTAWTTSSTAPATEVTTYDVSHLGDGKQSTVWAEGEGGAGLGSWVQADFGAAKTITSFTFWGSNWYNVEYFGHYNRPKTIIAEYGDGSTEEFTAKDEQVPQVFTLKAAKQTQTVKLRIKAIYSGKGVDTAVSEVKFFDTATEGLVPVASVTASSTAVSDVDGNYNPGNASDGISDSMWCEGNKKSDGMAEWVELKLSNRSAVSSLKIRNGAPSSDLYKAVNRPASATVSFSDGATESISLKDMLFEQSVSFPTHTTDSVRLTVTGVKKGEKYDDLCISEITVMP